MKWICLVAVALLAAGPFLSSRGLGTREAYNYSLATADAVTQFRAGEFPVLVGQSEFAFNGRIHPLRTAPGLAYAAGLADLVTFRQLDFWTLQNLVLALSLITGTFACYWALRHATPAPPLTAALLAAVYVLSPAVLAAAYGMDLYMTVLAVPCVPVILAANLTSFHDRSRAGLPRLAMALAAGWLAHPPVALWMSLATILLQAAALFHCRPDGRGRRQHAGAALLFIVLAGFGLAAALTVSPYGHIVHQRDTALLLTEVQRVFNDTLHPVSARADQLGDFQLGYVALALALVAAVLAVVRRLPAALALLCVAGFFLVLTVPVPVIHAWLWEHAPTLVINLTNQWPMQRLYLPVTALVLFAFALAWRPPAKPGRFWQDGRRLALAVAIGWTLWQGWRFVARGYATRQTVEATARSHFSSNLDLTPISYAILGTPPDFTNGVMDPAFSFRILAPFDAHPVASNWTAALPVSPDNRILRLRAQSGASAAVLDLSARLSLQPGQRYRLQFDFLTPPLAATLQIQGASLQREYPLPSSGGPRGFGMQPGQNHSLTLWTDQRTAEEVGFRLVAPGLANSGMRDRPIATLTVETVAPGQLPVELLSLIPLRCRVRAGDAGYLETPRLFTPGYSATVDGRPVRVQRSPDGLAMLPVPAGTSLVELRYPGPRLVRAAFWLSGFGWLGVLWGGLLRLAPPVVGARLKSALVSPAMKAGAAIAALRRRTVLIAAGGVLALLAAGDGWRKWSAYQAGVGPVRIRFVLPRGETNRQQPLLVTGQPQAGAFFVVRYEDDRHISLGFDSWGLMAAFTDPIELDYFAEHELVVSAGALDPENHPSLRGLPATELARRRNTVRLELDGRTVLEREVSTHDSTWHDITVGLNRIGGSSCEPGFAGQILSVERLSHAAPSPR